MRPTCHEMDDTRCTYVCVYIWVRLMYALNTSVFGKILSEIEKVLKILLIIEKAVKIFSISDKTFLKNGILLCILKAHVNKILFIYLNVNIREVPTKTHAL